eukprot:gene1520-1543_t
MANRDDGRNIDRAVTTDLRQAHHLLCSRFVSEDLFRQQIGGPRSELNAVMEYLRRPPQSRPAVTLLFDAAYYRALNVEVLTPETDPLLHFLQTGLGELRSPHPLIDLRWIASRDGLLLGTPPDIDGLMDLLDFDLASPSPYLDLDFYAPRQGGALQHYLTAGAAEGQRLNTWLDPAWYSRTHPDAPSDPYGATRHFVILGDREGRSPGPDFDSSLYRKRYVDVNESGLPPFLHYMAIGRAAGRPVPVERTIAVRSTDQPIDAATLIAADADIRQRLAAARARRKDEVSVAPPALISCKDPLAAARRLRFARPRQPLLSVLIPVFNEFATTVECLASLAQNGLGADMEIILADDASTEADIETLSAIKNLAVIRHAENLGFLRSCNAAFAHCRGDYVLLLNNDTQILPGALQHLMAALQADPTIAAAGPKLIYPNGRLQEAGCAVLPNGESLMVGLFADPAEPGYNRDRDVAYCSGAALMLRRSAIGDALFDDVFQPAYCEDTDLCLRLRNAGHRIRYVHQAVIVHHLSVSTNRGSQARKLRGIARNQHALLAKWPELIARLNEIRVLAFFLPQFHPTPENDLWWGRGFTEWTNVARAQPSYAGHYQPHLPADLGFYDLRLPETLHAQAALARRYGVEGFVFYHYNFGRQRMLERPLAILLANPGIDIRFCLCWANENWTRHWDGGSYEMLLEQLYDEDTIASVIADAIQAAADPRAITVRGRPMFLVYRPLKLPDARAFARECRERFAEAGFPGVHLVYVESMEASDAALSPADIGFDASVEFPPHGHATPSSAATEVIKDGWAGYRYDYPDTIINFTVRDSAPHTRYPAVFPGWDNTARQPKVGTSFDATPEAFRVYVEAKIDEVRAFLDGDDRLLFVNAWNEWAEGAHLEPDTGFGHRWLEAQAHRMTTLDDTPITLIGHPFAPIGMGEQLRSHIAALNAMHLHHRVLDIFGFATRSDPAHAALMGDREIRKLPGGIRIFHVNGDEVDNVRAAITQGGGRFEDGINIIVPAWELPHYPKPWAKKLRDFDEVWALSTFIRTSLSHAGIESHLVSQSVEPPPGRRLPRRHFGIRESAFVLLHFFDLSSYASRKNPDAVITLFNRLRTTHPKADLQLVLKVKQGEFAAEDWAVSHKTAGIHVIDQPLDTIGVSSLIAACDCFVSLHRSEGFGRGLGEAMAAGRLALGTNWSGNTDFLTDANGLPVSHTLIKLGKDQYPHWKGQHWAEPDLDHAVAQIEKRSLPVRRRPAFCERTAIGRSV